MSTQELIRLDPTRQKVSLAQIAGVHPLREELARRCSLLPTRYPPSSTFSPAGLLRMTRQFPVPVVAQGDHYFCIGSFRLFHLFRKGLPGRTKISVDVYSRLTQRALEEYILNDVLVVPVLTGLAPGDVRAMAHNWGRLQDVEFFRNLFIPAAPVAFSRLRGVKSRKPKVHE